ncbi:MAG TPA: hypothetical protein VMI13_07935 [Solirubrobacteraceae bacterium]|nr:hypothetical protein [Solirubrobacteraceae bacterium]
MSEAPDDVLLRSVPVAGLRAIVGELYSPSAGTRLAFRRALGPG